MLGDSPASQAVDGNIFARSITHFDDYNPWWKVWLARPVWVAHVEIAYSDSRKDMQNI